MNEARQNGSGAAETDVRILTLEEAEREDRVFWHSKTPAERLIATEQFRQRAYGYDPITARIQEVVEFTELKQR